MTYDEVVAIGRAYPGVVEHVTHGTPSLKVGPKFLLREREPGILAMGRPSIDERDFLIEADPDIFFITDHYRDYPYVLVRLSTITPDRFGALFETIWREKALKRHLRAYKTPSEQNN
jgi:hypothetical protein